MTFLNRNRNRTSADDLSDRAVMNALIFLCVESFQKAGHIGATRGQIYDHVWPAMADLYRPFDEKEFGAQLTGLLHMNILSIRPTTLQFRICGTPGRGLASAIALVRPVNFRISPAEEGAGHA
ncbi:MAG: hypothetical protein AAFR07_05715 [Pseudomonadota bacterium]